MKNKVKALLVQDRGIIEKKIHKASVVHAGEISIDDIVEEMFQSGSIKNKEAVADIIQKFNQVVVTKISNGYSVNNGLVNMSLEIKGVVYDKKINPIINKIELTFKTSKDLIFELNNMQIEVEECDDYERSIDKQINVHSIRSNNSYVTKKDGLLDGSPACGIAFRKWLIKP